MLRSLHLIQWIHIWNSVIGIITFGILIGVSSSVRNFIYNGSAIAGFGNFVTFAYPATYVFMYIPVISSSIYSIILAFDFSPNYKAWLPSKTMRGTIIFFTVTLFLAAVIPAIPGADVMADGSTLDCLWTNYMQWKVIYNDPITYPWVTSMDTACDILKGADAMCWILCLSWLAQSVLYIRAARNAKSLVKE